MQLWRLILSFFFLFVSAAVQAQVTGNQKTVVILAHFQDQAPPALTKSQAQEVAINQVNAYFNEVSYGNISILGDTFGWYVLPATSQCNRQNAADLAVRAADPFVNFSGVRRLIVIVPMAASAGACPENNSGTVGLTGNRTFSTVEGFVSMSIVWMHPGNVYMGSIAHELGHNFGLGHAGLLSCGSGAPLDGCRAQEYMDYFSVMGGGYPALAGGHFGAFDKEGLGWFKSGNLQQVSATGDFVLEPYETTSTSLKVLKIPRGFGSHLYVEYRQPIGTDANIGVVFSSSDVFQGALIRVDSFVVDTSAPTEPHTPALKPGQSLYDPQSGARISVLSRTPSSLTVRVEVAKTDFIGPAVSIDSPSEGASVSGTATIQASASDTSGVSKVEFFVDGILTATDATAPYALNWDTNFATNGPHTIRVRAFDRAGESFGLPDNYSEIERSLNVSNVDSVYPTVAVVYPTSGGSVSTNMPFIKASASDNRGIATVEVYVDTDEFPRWAGLKDGYYQTMIWFPPDSYGPHSVRVLAKDFVGNETWSDVINFEYIYLPAPSGLVSELSSSNPDTSVKLEWTDNSINETKFEVFRSIDGFNFVSVKLLSPNVVRYTDKNLSPNTFYFYKVVAKLGATSSEFSNLTMIQTAPLVVIPNPPSGLVVTKNPSKPTSSLILTWSDNSINEDGFEIERSSDGVSFTKIKTVTFNVITWTNNNLTSGTTYHYRIRSYNSAGKSPYSSAVSGKLD